MWDGDLLRILLGTKPLIVLCRLCSVNMADSDRSLFCDDDETCEKNVSESEDDGETYVSAPIG